MSDSAPLLDIPQAPAPAGAQAEWFEGAGGAKLRAALFRPAGQVRGSVVLSGGRTEPIEKYYEVISDFMDRGFVVLAHDWRGQGLSSRELPDRRKGHAKGYRSFLEDFRRLLDSYEDRLPKPWIAVGHSMGGCLTLLAMAHGERRFAGAALSAPMLGIKVGRSLSAVRVLTRMNLLLGRAHRFTPGGGLRDEDTFEGNPLTHDRRRFERHRAQIAANPDLALGAPTWGWLDFALSATAFLAKPERLRGVTAPVEIVSAGEDALVDNAAQAAAARNLPQGRLVSVPGAFHEILMERDDMRNIFTKVFDALAGKTAPKPAPRPAMAAAPAPVAKPAPTPAPAPAKVAAAPKPAAAKKPAAKKPAAKKPAAKKAAAKPAAAKKSATAKKAVAKKPAAKKPAAKKPAAKKATAKPATVKKAPVAKKPVAKKPAAKKPAAKKPAAKKATAKPAAVKKAPVAKKPAAKKAPARKSAPKK